MEKSKRNYLILMVLFFLFAAYLLMNTGIISDDFDAILHQKGKEFKDIIVPSGVFYFIETPVEYFTHFIWYYFFRLDNSIADSLMKILYICLSVCLVSKFFQIFVDKYNAFLISFLFIFFPSHDATVYCFMAQSMTLSFAFYLYSFYLAHRDKLVLAFIFALLASFISYGSPAIAIALFILFLLNKKFKKGLVLLIPNIFYSIYYLSLTKIMDTGIDKLAMSKEINIYSIIKQFILQIFTFIDSVAGPSMWLKIYYAFPQLSAASIIIGILLTITFCKKYQYKRIRYDAKLIVSLIVLAVSSFAMFSLTGYYPQLAFNLGNRTTIFGSLLLAYLIVLFPISKSAKALIFIIVIFSVLGISDHWKNWNIQQQKVMTNIRNNQDLKNYKDNKVVYIAGSQYSKYGPISHVEFLSEGWITESLVLLLLENKIVAKPINSRYVYKNGDLIDLKYNFKVKVNDYINVYDSERDIFFRLEADKINSYIASLSTETRHWVQMQKAQFIKNIVVKLMPRLKYNLHISSNK